MRFWKKKDKGPYPKSFAKRLTWRIMLTLFCVMSVVLAFIMMLVMGATYIEFDVLSRPVVTKYRLEAERVLSEVYVASVNTVPDIENSLQRPDRVAAIMKRIVELNPNVRSCGISFRENYYPQMGRLYCPYAIRNDSDSVFIMKTIAGQKQDYLKQEWFVEAMKAKEGYWSKPFFSGSDKKTPLVAYLLPIHDERDSTVAVLGVDVSLDKLFTEKSITSDPDSAGTEPWDPENEIYFFAIDSTGTYLSHPDRKRIINENYFDYAKASPDTLDDALGRRMASGEKKVIGDFNDDLTIDGEKTMVSYTPIKHTPWSLAFVVPTSIIDIIGYVLGGFLLLFILLGLLVVFFAGRYGIKRAARPLKQLAASADEVAKGNFDAPLPTMKSRDEIHQLRDSFENMQHSLTRYVAELRDTTAQKASFESELNIAHNIQMSMLPKTFPPYPERHDVDIYGSLTPAKGVGGDLFDFYIRDEKLFFCIGDVSGKGVPASLVMAVTRTLFRNVSSHVAEPQIILSAINSTIAQDNDTNMFVTLFIGVLDLHTGHVYYSNGGHDAPILIGSDVQVLPCDPNLPVGVMDGWEFTLQETDIPEGCTLFLFTDGLNEAEDISHAQFGDERIMQVAGQLAADGSLQPQRIIGSMTQAVHDFVGDAEQSDDLTMLAIQYKMKDEKCEMKDGDHQ